MKVAIINWAPIKNGPKEGGGVSIYSENICQELAKRGCSVTVISTGYYYDLRGRVAIKSEMKGGIHYVDVLNSPIIAPSALMFNAPIDAVQSAESDRMMGTLFRRLGPFDVVHIQNVEGFSFSSLRIIKDVLPKAKLILSCHNYHVLCPQVTLWRQDSQRCSDFNRGSECVSCNRTGTPVLDALAKRWLSKLPRSYRKAFRPQLRAIFKWNAKLRRFCFAGVGNSKSHNHPSAGDFAYRRDEAVKYVNEFCDHVVCVSEVVRDIMMRHGVVSAKLSCSYVGTAHFDPARMRGRAATGLRKDGEMTIAFLGYMSRHKGFHFLVDACERIPTPLAAKINLKVAAKFGDRSTVDRLRRLGSKFKSLIIRDGYSQGELAEILSDVDLGLVTPLWDDALPQVAIEFVCHGVPILVSDRGGQKELAADPRFIFDSSSIDDFLAKLSAVYDKPALIGEFWDADRPLRTNMMHVDELMSFYCDR